MNTTRLATLLALSLSVAAQDAPQVLTQTGRAFALGGKAYLQPAQQYGRFAITVGMHGDVVCWDTKKRSVLGRVGPRPEGVKKVALHPEGEWIAICRHDDDKRPSDRDEVYGCDLRTGARRRLFKGLALQLGFDASGKHLGAKLARPGRLEFASFDVSDWQRECDERWRERTNGGSYRRLNREHCYLFASPRRVHGESTSPDGARHITWHASTLRCASHEYDLEQSISATELYNDGTALVLDELGQVRFLDTTRPPTKPKAEPQLATPHCGDTEHLEFSLDGRHLAIQSTAAVTVVSLDGEVGHVVAGTHLVAAGKDAAEFWIIGRRSGYRWDADTGRRVGEQREWQKPAFDLLQYKPYRANCLLPLGRTIDLPGTYSTRSLVIVDGAPMFADGNVELALHRWRADGWQPLAPFESKCRPRALHALDGGQRLLLSWLGESLPGLGSPHHLSILDRDGKELRTTRTTFGLDWAAIDDEHGRIWLQEERYVSRVRGLRSNDLTEIKKLSLDYNCRHAIPWHAGTLLTTDGKTLTVLDPMSEAVLARYARPEGLAEIDLIAASPDRSHIAVAHRYDVRILRVPQ